MLGRACTVGLLVANLAAAAGPTPSLDEARSLHAAGRLDEALAAYDAVAHALAADDPGQAAIARNNACVILMNRGDHRAAAESCREALRLLDRADDPVRRSRTLNNLGLVLQYLGEYEEAERRFGQALALNRERGDVESQVINQANLGVLAIQAGRYAEALAAQAAVLELARQNPEAPWSAAQTRVARINQAVVLERLGAYREALDLYRDVLDQGGPIDPRDRATLLVNVGVVYRNLGDPVRAAETFEQAIDEFGRLGDRSGLANAWLNLALVNHLNLERLDEAEAAYLRALELSREAGDRAEEIQDLGYLGRLLLDLGRLDEAEARFEQCLAAADASGSSEGRWKAREGLGRVAAARGDGVTALDHLESALAEIEGVRASLDATSYRSRYFRDKRAVYAATVDVLADLERAEPGRGFAERALAIVQRAKSRSLLDALGEAGRPAEPLQAAAIAAEVGDDLLLEYFTGERGLYGWSVHAGRVRMAELGPASRIFEDAGAVHAALARGEEPPADAVDRLSLALLGSFGALPEGTTTLHVAPDGKLRYLPFELLRAGEEPRARLIERVAVDYLPSGSTLGRTAPERGSEPDRLAFAGIGAPGLPPGGAGPTPASLLVARFDLRDLPGAESELATVRRDLSGPSEVRVGPEANEEALVELGRRGARVLHVASHTVLDESTGGAAILLAPSPGSDGVLRPAEIAGLDYRVDLTVLATCSSALGAEETGDALASLTGALLAAGSSAVVASLWDVDDAASLAFMEQLYHELGRGARPAEALRLAKLRMIEDPYWGQSSRWAAWVLVGRSGPVASASGLAWSTGGGRVILLLVAAAVAAGLVVLFAVRLRRARQ